MLEESASFDMFILEFLGRQATDDAEREAIRKIGQALHDGAYRDLPPAEPVAPDAVDIGMSDIKRLNYELRQRRAAPEAPKRQLTCDEIADRAEAKKAANKAEQKASNERTKEIREQARAAADESAKARRYEAERERYEQEYRERARYSYDRYAYDPTLPIGPPPGIASLKRMQEESMRSVAAAVDRDMMRGLLGNVGNVAISNNEIIPNGVIGGGM